MKRGVPYPTRLANDPPPIKEVVGKSGYPLNGHNLIPPYRLAS